MVSFRVPPCTVRVCTRFGEATNSPSGESPCARYPLFYPKLLVRRWSRIGGKRPQSIRRLVADGEELLLQVERLRRRRQAHGYRFAGAAGGGDGGGGGVKTNKMPPTVIDGIS